MSSWYETRIDRQLREAAERGEFDDLPGSGKPLPNRGEQLDEEWWIKGLIRRESLAGDGLAAALPPALALRKEVEDLPKVLARKHSEAVVRGVVSELNDRIMLARRGPVDGPPVAVNPLDADEVVRAWRSARTPAPAPVVPVQKAGGPPPKRSDAARRNDDQTARSGWRFWRRRAQD